MKKFLLITLLSGFSTMAAAEGLYIQGELGTSRLVLKADNQNHKDTVTNTRISVGKSFGNARYALDYTHFGKVKFHL
ncbi:hypothetical protein PL75_08085 [Neisseria arctica]|uniref:Porin domain-containing protein n=1 Tax=Neisseria arctica TaxID=1470200 RepID=A0A0J0YQT3_9NEIS|nr:hypothetical protein [Neisseria arctica]KLT72491.1 hypothetical protein PL75_08085 [Neisseria arctica]UOO86393.1 hypothetical protein LVJ86_09305 [Neisseria arctica]